MENSIFEKQHSFAIPQLSSSMYNLAIGLTLCWGFLINWLTISSFPVESLKSINSWVFFIGYFILCISGIVILNRSNKPIFSFIGYNMIVVPFGFLLNLIVSQYSSSLVLEAMRVTGQITFVMMLLGSMYPAFFLSIGRALFLALFVSIIVQIIEVFIFHKSHSVMDWVVAIIFSGYIGYDWARANSIPKTIDNAIDSAAALYLDIINLFVRVLSIFGRD